MMTTPMAEYFGDAASAELLDRWPKAEFLDHGRLLSALCWTFTDPSIEDAIILELLGHIAALTEQNQQMKKSKSYEDFYKKKAERKGTQMQNLADAMEEMVVLIESSGLKEQLDALRKKHAVVEEICEFGAAGPVGIGFGNFGGHAVGSAEDEE